MARVVMLVGYRPVSCNSSPQTRQVDAFDRPEVNKAALLDESQCLRLRRKGPGWCEMKAAGAMDSESFKINAGHAPIVVHAGYICKQTYNAEDG